MKKFFNYEYWKDIAMIIGTVAVCLSFVGDKLLGIYYSVGIFTCLGLVIVAGLLMTCSKFLDD